MYWCNVCGSIVRQVGPRYIEVDQSVLGIAAEKWLATMGPIPVIEIDLK